MADTKTIILAIESSGNVCSAGLSIGDEIAALCESSGNNLHDKLLAEYVKRILNDLDMEFSEIDAVAVGSGPGSFTGLRIGASIAKGMTFDNVPKLIAVPHLTALAESAVDIAASYGTPKILSVIKSHKNLIYSQIFDLNINALTEVTVIPTEELTKKNFPDSLLVGPLNVYPQGFKTHKILNKLSASILLKTAFRYYNDNNFTNSETFIPQYFQDFTPTT